MATSIGLRLIGWLKHVRNQRAKKVVQVLSGSEIQSQSTRNVYDWGVVGINDHGPEAKIDYAVVVPKLRDEIHELDRFTVVSKVPPIRPYSDFPTGFDHNFILAHQTAPIGQSPLAHDNQ